MPELPEIANRADEMNKELVGKTIRSVEVIQPKCINKTPADFSIALAGRRIIGARYHGKWILTELDSGWLLINMGMGGELLLTTRQDLPVKHPVVIDFVDGTCLSISFWWFGYVHHCEKTELTSHPMVSKLGPNILDLNESSFIELLKNQRSRLKAFLLDQSKVAGIGNAYIHDILFLARLHPNRVIANLSELELHQLYDGIQKGLYLSLKKGGAFYEKDLYGQKGGFTMEDILIGYRENQPCPNCSTPIIKIKTGSNSSFICPHCQPEY
jgi:formamidopyrimidine-DNA glycosylase